MTKRNLQYFGIVLICLIIILSLGNPSPNQFKDFIGKPDFESYSMLYKRTSNWLIFSTYEFSYESPLKLLAETLTPYLDTLKIFPLPTE